MERSGQWATSSAGTVVPGAPVWSTCASTASMAPFAAASGLTMSPVVALGPGGSDGLGLSAAACLAMFMRSFILQAAGKQCVRRLASLIISSEHGR